MKLLEHLVKDDPWIKAFDYLCENASDDDYLAVNNEMEAVSRKWRDDVVTQIIRYCHEHH